MSVPRDTVLTIIDFFAVLGYRTSPAIYIYTYIQHETNVLRSLLTLTLLRRVSIIITQISVQNILWLQFKSYYRYPSPLLKKTTILCTFRGTHFIRVLRRKRYNMTLSWWSNRSESAKRSAIFSLTGLSIVIMSAILSFRIKHTLLLSTLLQLVISSFCTEEN